MAGHSPLNATLAGQLCGVWGTQESQNGAHFAHLQTQHRSGHSHGWLFTVRAPGRGTDTPSGFARFAFTKPLRPPAILMAARLGDRRARSGIL